MDLFNAKNYPQGFSILETTRLSQHAFMTLQPGEASSDAPSIHPQSDQALILLGGELRAEIGEEVAEMKAGDAVLVKAGEPHKFLCTSQEPAVAYTTYAAPAYPGE